MELFENIEPVNIEDEIKVSYLDYAMSVIIGRALPDVRDGLKPVHRRILYTMSELGNDYNKPYKKSARVVGDVMGKYHPHGDQSIYDALARMAQDFSMRYMLADGQGNFGSIDGDPPAAMRYTEVRMAKLAHEFLADIEKETVDFIPNYDGSLAEPAVLPSRAPGLLINGSSGIAVGMATNVPPHNLREICEALITLIENPDVTIDQLIEKVPGPDFPSAGFILGQAGIREAYHTGRGIIRLRARALVETGAKEKKSLIITELPYQVNKARLIESIDELVRGKKIEGIGDIRDESDREGLRVVLEIKSSHREVAEIILNQLYRLTQLEISFGINMLAIVGQAPRVLSLKDVLVHFLNHRKDVVIRRTRFELAKAEARAHILEGLRKALDQLDLVISLIRSSRTPQEARQSLSDKLTLSDRQAQAILDLRLQKLTRLERKSIDNEYIELMKTIAHLRDILGSERLVYQVIQEELATLKDEYSDERRTQILAQVGGDFAPEDLIADEDMVVTISHGGYIKRNPVSLYKAQRRGGRGITAAKTKEDDFVASLYVASAHSYLLFLTSRGRLHWLKVHEVPQGGRTARGKALVNVLPLGEGEKVATVLPVKDLNEPGRYVVMATRNGTVKRVELAAFYNPRKNGIIALTIGGEDELVWASLTDGHSVLILSTQAGKAICFEESEVRAMGRQAAGVRGISLAAGDRVVSMDTLSSERTETLMSVTENGYGKRTLASEYRLQARGGMGLITIKTNARNGQVVGVLKVTGEDRVMLITNTGRIILFKVGEVSLVHRNTQGVKLIEVAPGERVVDVAPAGESQEDGFDQESGAEEV